MIDDFQKKSERKTPDMYIFIISLAADQGNISDLEACRKSK